MKHHTHFPWPTFRSLRFHPKGDTYQKLCNNSWFDIIRFIIFCSRIIHFFINGVKFCYHFSRRFFEAFAAARTTFEIARFNSRIFWKKEKSVIKIQQKCFVRFFGTEKVQMQFDFDCQIEKKNCFSYQYENWFTNTEMWSLFIQ